MTHRDTTRLEKLAERMRRDARLLGETLRDEHEAAHTHLTNELSVLGWPRRGDTVSVSGGGGMARDCDCDGRDQWCDACRPTSAVERDADASYQITAIREDVRDQVEATWSAYNAYLDHVKALGIILHTARRTGMSKTERAALKLDAVKPAICADHQHGKHGVDEWGDALCFLPSVKSGLCTAHYWAWYRKRKADGIDTTREFGAA